MKHKKLITMFFSTQQKRMAGVRAKGDFSLFAILYILILEPHYFFKNTVLRKKGTKKWFNAQKTRNKKWFGDNLPLKFIGIGYCEFYFMVSFISCFLVKSPCKIISVSLNY